MSTLDLWAIVRFVPNAFQQRLKRFHALQQTMREPDASEDELGPSDQEVRELIAGIFKDEECSVYLTSGLEAASFGHAMAVVACKIGGSLATTTASTREQVEKKLKPTKKCDAPEGATLVLPAPALLRWLVWSPQQCTSFGPAQDFHLDLHRSDPGNLPDEQLQTLLKGDGYRMWFIRERSDDTPTPPWISLRDQLERVWSWCCERYGAPEDEGEVPEHWPTATGEHALPAEEQRQRLLNLRRVAGLLPGAPAPPQPTAPDP